MHAALNLRRLALAAVASAAAVAAISPSVASAASTCTFDTAAKRMTITQDSQPVTLSAGSAVQFRDGSGPIQNCFSPSGVRAGLFNTDSISVVARTPAAAQELKIDLSGGMLGPGATVEPTGHRSAIEVNMNTGGVGDRITVLGTPADEGWRMKDLVNLGGTPVGPRIDLDGDTDTDVSGIKVGLVQAQGGRGRDTINAVGAKSFAVSLQGGPDGDFLIGGEQRDLLMGEDGDDFLGAKEQVTPQADVVQGGANDDTAQIDAPDNAQLSGVEHLIF